MNTEKLKQIVSDVRKLFNADQIDPNSVSSIIQSLAIEDYSFNRVKFPALVNTDDFTDVPCGSPSNLAEALLWKLGKWNAYVNFTNIYHDDKSEPSNTDTVFYAFARHLKDDQFLMYDQNVLRALCAVDTTFSEIEIQKCKSVLTNKKGEWKQAGSGSKSICCYSIFTTHADRIIKKGISSKTLDELLMPLGRALKKVSSDYASYKIVCDWEK